MKMPYGMEAKECRGHSREKTSETNVGNKHEGMWSYIQYDGKIQEQLGQGDDRISLHFQNVILLHNTNVWSDSTPSYKEGPLPRVRIVLIAKSVNNEC